MTGIELARQLGVSAASNRVELPDGPAAVVAAYCRGASPIFRVGVQSRPAGSSSWVVDVDPIKAGDGPGYRIPSRVADRFGLAVRPPVPDAATLEAESASLSAQLDAADALFERDESARFWRGLREDVGTSIVEAPGVLGYAVGSVAGGAVRAVTSLVGGAAGALYGSLPVLVQIAIPVGIAGVLVAGAVRAARGVSA